MVTFKRVGTSGLYAADSNGASGGWGFAITRALDPPGLPDGPIALADALTHLTWQGSLVSVAAGPFPGSDGDPTAFLDKLGTFVENASVSGQGAIVFLPDGSGDVLAESTFRTYALLNRSAQQITTGGMQAVLAGDGAIVVRLDPNATLSVPAEGDRIAFDLDDSPAATLIGPCSPDVQAPPANRAELHVGGPAGGALTFPLTVLQASLGTKGNWGFQVLIPNAARAAPVAGGSPLDHLAAWLPFADHGAPGAVLGFTAQVNPVNPRNAIGAAARTVLLFDGPDVALASYYRTNYGKTVTLTPVTDPPGEPAGLVIDDGYVNTPTQNGLRLAPTGDFAMGLAGAAAGTPYQLLCGLSGTETIDFLPAVGAQAGTRLRFVENQPANVPQFPLQAASPVGPPIQPGVSLFDPTFLTSWASVVAPPTDPQRLAHYTAAPKGAELFGGGTAAPAGLLGPMDPGMSVPGAVVYPLFPYAGFTPGDGAQDLTADQLEQVSREIVSPTRKGQIAAGPGTATAASARVSLFAEAGGGGDGDALVSTTTPTGFITAYGAGDGAWKQLLLAQVGSGSSVTRQMGFTGLDPELQSAFQTSDQFLVVANAQHLGPFVPASPSDARPLWFMPPATPPPVTTPGFYNTINIGSWNFGADTGAKNAYGDYHSVMLVKGVKGKILDVDPKTGQALPTSLLRSPDKWTMRDVFATPDPPDTSQLGVLSDWLVEYCLAAYAQRDDPYFENFADVIQDPDWTGVLILKATIKDVPPELAGILAGVDDPADFYAHHIGIEIGQIDGTKVQQTDTTSMFGLVHYVDPRYDDTLDPHPIAPSDLDAPYDFTLLTLKALFENSAIKKFDSLAQTVLNRVFGSVVTAMVDEKPTGPETNMYNAVLLEGGVQRNGDAVVYSLASRWPNRFSLANDVLTSVEVDTAQMSTRDDGTKSGQVVSWIAMSGFMNFALVPATDKLPQFDVFSFGPDDATTLRQGLLFDGLGLRITIPRGGSPALALVEDEIAFSTSASHARGESLFKSFQLELLTLVSGDAGSGATAKSDPASLGYLPAVTEYGLRGVGDGGWHGLTFKLSLGTPGALAGKVNLDSTLLVAWADAGGGAADGATDLPAFVGVALPGAGPGGDLFSLQTVIKLSIGLIQLMYVAPSAGPPATTGGFVLVLNELALKLFGLLKIPPSGNTAFLLFGGGDVTDATGLGWFAVYNKAKADKPDTPPALARTSGA
ncbi:MAG TPA: hypothetical protein VF587_14875 [Solirubrobacteraceae bacterium]|jgi:hypothetical protein